MSGPTDFRNYRAARTAAPPVAAPAPVSKADMPLLKPGTVMYHLADHEKALAKQLGLDPANDPIPENLAEWVAAATADSSHILPVPPGTPPLAAPPETTIDRLTPAHRDDVLKFVSEMREMAKKFDDMPTTAATGIREAIAVAAAPTTRGEVRERSLAAPKPIAAPPSPPPVPTPPSPSAVSDTGASGAPPGCPRCGCDPTMYTQVTPTPDQKYAYLAMILGGPTTRFHHDVPLFGGNVVVTFRSLSAADNRMVFEQMGADHRKDAFPNDLAYLNRLTEYRMVLSVERISLAGRGDHRMPEAAAETAVDGQPTALPLLAEYLRDELLVSESLTRAVSEAFRAFQRLVETMEARSEDPGFWSGIGAGR